MKTVLYFIIPVFFLLVLIGLALTMYRETTANQKTIDAVNISVK